jgi:hypothetical protein
MFPTSDFNWEEKSVSQKRNKSCCHTWSTSSFSFVYYEGTYTGFHGGLEHLNIETRLIDESEMGKCDTLIINLFQRNRKRDKKCICFNFSFFATLCVCEMVLKRETRTQGMRGSQCCLALLVLAGQTVAFAPGVSFDLRRRDYFRFAGSLNSRSGEARLQEPSRAANLALQGKPRSVRLPVFEDYAVSCASACGSVSTTPLPLGGILHKLMKVAILVATVFMTAPFQAQARDGPRLMAGKADAEEMTFSSKRSETSHPRKVVYLVAAGVTDVKVLACLMSLYSSLLWLLFIFCRPTRSAFSPSLSPSLPFFPFSPNLSPHAYALRGAATSRTDEVPNLPGLPEGLLLRLRCYSISSVLILLRLSSNWQLGPSSRQLKKIGKTGSLLLASRRAPHVYYCYVCPHTTIYFSVWICVRIRTHINLLFFSPPDSQAGDRYMLRSP